MTENENAAEYLLSPTPRYSTVLALMVLLAGLWAYRNSFTAPFLFDDLNNIVENTKLDRFWPTADSLLVRRPIPHLSLAINFALGGLDVRGYHAVNIAIHFSAGLILFDLARRTLVMPRFQRLYQRDAAGIAFAAALIWTVHPLQTESVTYTIQRCESLMGLFFLLALYCVSRSVRSSWSWAWYLGSGAACWLGMASKEVMAAAPFVIALYDRIFLSNSWEEVVRRRWGLYLVFLSALAWLMAGLAPAFDPDRISTIGLGTKGLSPWEYLSSQPAVILHYFRLSFWPDVLCLDYRWPISRTNFEIFGLGVIILAMLGSSLAALRYRPAWGFLGTSIFLILAPTSSVMPIKDLAVEHRMYLPLAPLVVLVVLGAHRVSLVLPDDKARKLLRGGLLAMVALPLILRTIERNWDYNNPIKMWSNVLRVAPNNDRAHYNLARQIRARGELELAIEYYEQVLQLNPYHEKAHNDLAISLAGKALYREAAEHYEAALRIDPEYAIALVNYGNLHARAGRFGEAEVYYRKAIKADTEFAAPHVHLGEMSLRQGKLRSALANFRRADVLAPNQLGANTQIAWILATADDQEIRDGQQAVEIAERLVRQFGESEYRLLDVLAAGYAEVGRIDEAIEKARAAYHLASAAEREEDKQAIQLRLKQYREGEPYRIHEGEVLQGALQSASE